VGGGGGGTGDGTYPHTCDAVAGEELVPHPLPPMATAMEATLVDRGREADLEGSHRRKDVEDRADTTPENAVGGSVTWGNGANTTSTSRGRQEGVTPRQKGGLRRGVVVVVRGAGEGVGRGHVPRTAARCRLAWRLQCWRTGSPHWRPRSRIREPPSPTARKRVGAGPRAAGGGQEGDSQRVHT
jgi:hypothetical protein